METQLSFPFLEKRESYELLVGKQFRMLGVTYTVVGVDNVVPTNVIVRTPGDCKMSMAASIFVNHQRLSQPRRESLHLHES
jgi:hypothetical protein